MTNAFVNAFRRVLVASLLGVFFFSGCQSVRPGVSRDSQSAHAWLEISRSAFESNIRTMQKLIGERVKLCAVMKADAYGHGMELLMPSVVSLHVPCVGFTSNAEAKVARAQGFRGSLVRLRTATLSEAEAAIPYDVEELVGNLEFAKVLAEIARKSNHIIRYHLALNSGGMSRNGLEFKNPDAHAAALAILALPSLSIVGIMTHFPVEEVPDVRKGLALFNDESAWIIKNGGLDRAKITLHTANSFTALAVPEARLDMVRPGGALYGDTIPERTEYMRVMQFKSRVAVVNRYPAGNTVNYDRTFTLKRDSRLANIPVGYSDGYRRVFSNRGHVLIRGKRFPIVGRVTMNTIMVDVTDDISIQSGDEVVLFGKQSGSEITQAELEKDADTILPDLYTVWGNSNPRFLVE